MQMENSMFHIPNLKISHQRLSAFLNHVYIFQKLFFNEKKSARDK